MHNINKKRTPSLEYLEEQKKKKDEALRRAAARQREGRESRAATALTYGDGERANRILQGRTYDAKNVGGVAGGVQGIGIEAARKAEKRRKNLK